jgi:hypothetical protein
MKMKLYALVGATIMVGIFTIALQQMIAQDVTLPIEDQTTTKPLTVELEEGGILPVEEDQPIPLIGYENEITLAGQANQLPIGEQIQKFIDNLHTLSAEEIETHIIQILSNMPNTVNFAGFTIVIPQEATLDQQFANQMNTALSQLTSQAVDHINMLKAVNIVMIPDLIYSQLKFGWQLSLPASIEEFFKSLTELTNKLMLSKSIADQEGMQALQTVANKFLEIFEKLYNNRNNLAGLNLSNDISSLRETFKANFNAISVLVRNHSTEFTKLINDLKQIKISDLEEIAIKIKTKLGMA